MIRSDYRRLVGTRLPELPGSLRLTSTFPFVGRAAELETLRTLMPRAEGEGRRVVLLGGEPGSGKSRLVREFAGEAAADGALVLYGACDAVVRTPYGPFVEALDHLARTADPAELRAALGTGGGELTRLLPDLPVRVGELPPPVEGRSGHRAPPPAHGRDRPARRRHAQPAGAPRARGRPLGRRLDAAAPPSPDACRRARARAAARDLPRHRGRRARGALGDARRPAPLRRRRPAATSPGSPATRSPSSSGAPPEASSAPSCASSPSRSTTSRRATRFSCASSGAPSSRPAPSRWPAA